MNILYKGTIKNRIFLPDRPNLYNSILDQYEGKRVSYHITEIIPDKTPGQLGYYYAGIIRTSCMNSSAFAGWEEKRIDTFLRLHVGGTYNKLGFLVPFDISESNEQEMSNYIQQVIIYLSSEHHIEILSPDEYKYGKSWKI